MSLLFKNGIGGSGEDVGDIGHSLRFRSSGSAYLSKTLASGSGTQWSLSVWVKRAELGKDIALLNGGDGTQTNSTNDYVGFTAANKLTAMYHTGVGGNWYRTFTPDFRDITSYFHILLSSDLGNATVADRLILWINGVRVTSYTDSSTVPNGTWSYLNKAYGHNIGRMNAGSGPYYGDIYLSRFCFVDGQVLTPSSFGYLNNNINEWVSKSQSQVKAVVDAGGTNSFMLDFDNGTSTTTLGYDKSSKGNNWTCNNISLTAGATYDWMLDVPGNSYAVLNPIAPIASGTISVANLTYTTGNSDTFARGTFCVSSGKWYYEATNTSNNASPILGITKTSVGSTVELRNAGTGNAYSYLNTGYKSDGSGGSGTSYGATFTTNDVIGVAFDLDAGTITFHKQTGGTGSFVSQGQAYSGISGEFAPAIGDTQAAAGGQVWDINFGQRPFNNTSIPTGFKALCQANLPEPTISNPKKHFDVKLDTGANIKTNTAALFTYYWNWIKDRANVNNHQLIDTVRGSTAVLQSNTAAAETTYSAPSGSSVGWAWNINAAAVSNTNGSITSSVSANALAGQSVVTFQLPASNLASTVGHGLLLPPELIITLGRSVGSSHTTYHSAIGATIALFLNTTAASGTSQKYWNNVAPTSSVFSIMQTGVAWWDLSSTQVAYCFHSVAGYSKIGSYTGNGSTDGPFVHCGFKPKYVMWKRTDLTGDWLIHDGSRATYNQDDTTLYADLSAVETVGGGYPFDITSNGFKVRGSAAYQNASGGTYIFYAVADVPNKYSLAR